MITVYNAEINILSKIKKPAYVSIAGFNTATLAQKSHRIAHDALLEFIQLQREALCLVDRINSGELSDAENEVRDFNKKAYDFYVALGSGESSNGKCR